MERAQGLPIASDDRYRLLIEAVTDYAIYMLDPMGHVSSWNPGAERIKGFRESEILGQHFSRFYTDEDRRSGLPARALRTAEVEGRFEHEGWRLRKDGTRFWAYVVIDPIRGPSGTLLGFAKITRDLTERRAGEEALRRSEERFRLLVQSVTDYALYMLDPEGRVTNWNLGAERIKGHRPFEIIGKHFSAFYTPEDRERGEPEKALATAANQGRFEKEGWRVRKDGTRFWASVVIDPIRDERGTILGFAKVTRDITERRDAQVALEKARDQLFQSQKIEAIGQLTGGIAHDFNNLLMAVLGSLELLRKRMPDDDRSLRLLDNAVKAAERGAGLTQRMLAFARRQEMRPSPVDVAALVHGMADLLQRSLGPQVRIETHFPLALPRIYADANQIELALLNLAVNARDAMPDGGTITIAASTGMAPADGPLEPGRYVCLTITDTGTGMDEATLAHATEPFFTTKGPGKGTGLGLSLVHGVAQQSGGDLTLHSRPGAGTTAELRLPVADADATTAPGKESPGAVAPAPALVILAVDDDPLVLMNTAGMLEDLGHRVVEATSAREALAAAAALERIDLLVTDQAMPQMTGLQLAEAIRADRPDLPVVLATGYAELPGGGAAWFRKLDKPFTESDLARAVAEAVALSGKALA